MFTLTLVFCCVAVAVNLAAPVLLDSHHLFSVANPSYSLEIPYPSARSGYFASSPVDTRVFSDASGGTFVVISDPYSSNLQPAVPPVSLVESRYGAYPPGQVTLLNTFNQPGFRSGTSFQTPVGPLESSGHVSHFNPAFGSGVVPPTGSFPGGSGPASRDFPQGGPGYFPGGPQVPRGPGFPGGPEVSGAFQQGLGGPGGPNVPAPRGGPDFPSGPEGSGAFQQGLGGPGGPNIPAPRGGPDFPSGPEGSRAFHGPGGAGRQHDSTPGAFPRGPSGSGGFLGGPETAGTFSHGPGAPAGIGTQGPSPGPRSGPGGFHPPQGPGSPSSAQGAHGARPHGPPGPQH